MILLAKIKNLKFPKSLWVIFVFALFIRVSAVAYGLPLMLNSDEPSLVSGVLSLKDTALVLSRFDWPHLHFYLNFVFYVIVILITRILGIFDVGNIIGTDLSIYFYTSRIINSLMGALTIFPVFLFAKNLLQSKKKAILVAFLFSIMPVHVVDSHLALLDTAMTFWLSISLYFSSNLIFSYTRKNFVLAGLFFGLAFSTKYTCFLYIFYFTLLLLVISGLDFRFDLTYNLNSIRKAAKKMFSKFNILNYLYFFITSIAVYLVTNFSIFIKPEVFWSNTYGRGFLFQFENVGEKQGFEYPASLYENFIKQGFTDYGFTLLAIMLIIFILFLFFSYRNKITLLTVFFPLFFYFFISTKDRSPSHYFIFLYPLITISVVSFLSDLSSYLRKSFKFFGRIPKSVLLYVLYSIAIFSPLSLTLKDTYRYINGDTRTEFRKWVIDKSEKSIPIFYYGENMESVTFPKDIVYEKIVFVDIGFMETSSPYSYLVLGMKDLQEESLTGQDKDVEEIDGGEQDVIEHGVLVKKFMSSGRLGPNIYVFKINNDFKND